jgi:hypothetical protein
MKIIIHVRAILIIELMMNATFTHDLFKKYHKYFILLKQYNEPVLYPIKYKKTFCSIFCLICKIYNVNELSELMAIFWIIKCLLLIQ